ncbi:MAG: cysteine desulfurase [Chlamydiia bacterium]|nr:cysteine desulfurase [Chlamydiia bacterium]
MRGHPLVYLDSAATSHKPNCVIDTIADFYRNEYGTVHRAVYELAMHSTERYSAVRRKVQAFFHAESEDEIIFTRGTTEAMNLIASSYGRTFVQKGDQVLVCCIDHHSNIVPWQMLCQERGAELKVIPVNDAGEIDLEAYRALLNPRVKVVSTSHVANSLGTIHPIKDMVAMAHAVGAIYVADGAQSAPHMQVDVQDLDVDFYAFSGHKMLAPSGIGGLYGKRAHLEAMPPYQGGGDMIERVSFAGTTYNAPPLKFEAGTPDIAQVIGLGAAIDYIEAIGRDTFTQWEHTLLQAGTERLSAIPGLRIIGTAKEKAGIISFVVEGVHHLDIGTLLDLKGIAVRTGHHCTMPAMERFGVPGTVRASFSIYNTLEEVHRFADGLIDVIGKLR